MEALEAFYFRIPDTEQLNPKDFIDYFAYFLLKEQGQEAINQKDILSCYESLELKPYSNVSMYLSNSLRGSKPKYIRKSKSYVLSRHRSTEISEILGDPIRKMPSDNLLPMHILTNTRKYVEKIAHQAGVAYDCQIYDACLVMLRKLIECLIIELYERFNLSDNIKDGNGHFLFLSDLIPLLIEEKAWNLSRNAKSAIKSIKKYGDLSAHNRRFSADKQIIDDLKDDLRIVIQELVYMIDYPDWNSS